MLDRFSGKVKQNTGVMAGGIEITSIRSLLAVPPRGTALLAVFAHPDDESLLLGGTLAAARNEGFSTRLVTVTRGELGGRHSGVYGEALARMRARELERASDILGIGGVTQLRFRDQGVRDAYTDVVHTLARVITSLRPAVLITHGPERAHHHTDHAAVARAVRDAILAVRPGWPCLHYGALLRPHASARTLAFDISRFADAKIRACSAHASQAPFASLAIPAHVYYALNHFEYFIPV